MTCMKELAHINLKLRIRRTVNRLAIYIKADGVGGN
jgi:hypothetical protein